jgi:hypothetical protein
MLSLEIVIDLLDVGVHAIRQRRHAAEVRIEALVVSDQKLTVPIRLEDLSEAIVMVFCSSATDFPALLPSSTFPVSSSI